MQQLGLSARVSATSDNVLMHCIDLAVDNCPVSRVALMQYPCHQSSVLGQLLLLLTTHCGSPSVCILARCQATGDAVSTSLECVESFVTDQWSTAQLLTTDSWSVQTLTSGRSMRNVLHATMFLPLTCTAFIQPSAIILPFCFLLTHSTFAFYQRDRNSLRKITVATVRSRISLSCAVYLTPS